MPSNKLLLSFRRRGAVTAFLAQIPDCRLVVFEKSGQSPFIEERKGFTDVIVQFLI